MITYDLEQQALALPDQATALLIVDIDSYMQASELLLTIKDLLRKIEDTFTPMTQIAHAAWKETIAQRKRHEDPLLTAEAILKARISTYRDTQERQRLIAEQEAQQAAQLQEAVDAERAGDMVASEAALNGHGLVSVAVASPVPTV